MQRCSAGYPIGHDSVVRLLQFTYHLCLVYAKDYVCSLHFSHNCTYMSLCFTISADGPGGMSQLREVRYFRYGLRQL